MNDDSSNKPRKILLGKKVIRHFAIRTGIQTGAVNSAAGSDSTDDSSSGANPSNNTGTTCSANTSTGANCTALTSVATPPPGGFAVTKSSIRC